MQEPLSFSIDNITFQADSVFTGLGQGLYTAYVRDTNGCIDSMAFAIDSMPRPQLVSASTDSSYCSLDNGSITLHATSGVGTLTYSLDNSTFQSDSVFTGLAAGTYTGYVRTA